MFGIEALLVEQLKLLKSQYHLKGIKAEFEAEGSSFRDLVRLRRLTGMCDVELHVKIGGVEAIRDIKDVLEIGVDGIIAPMVESKFGLLKFIKAYQQIYKNHRIHLSFNVETKNAIDQFDEILPVAEEYVDNITIGRSDLSGSYLREDIVPDSAFIFDTLEIISKKIRQNNKVTMTVGGSLSNRSVALFNQRPDLAAHLACLETRKIILPTAQFLSQPQAIKEALRFEELYILSKKEFSDMAIGSEIARLTQLKSRS